SRSQCEGREFDPPPLHQFFVRCTAFLAALGMAAAWGAEGSAPGVLRIGTPGDYAPYSWYDANTETWRGSDIALARALAANLGLRAVFVATSWSTLLADAKAGRFDIAVGGISITAERQRAVDFSTPYAADRKQPVVRCGEEKHYDTQAEINRPQVRLIVNAGGTNERFAHEQFPAATLTVHADNRTVFDELRAGRADVMVTDSVEGRLQQRAQQGLCVAKTGAKWAPADKAILIAGGVMKHDVDGALARLGGKARYRLELGDWEGYSWSAQDTGGVRLAALIDERLAVVVEVARSKWNSQAAIEDSSREQQLLQSLRARAATMGVTPETVNSFFGAQIEAAKVLQGELFARWRKQKQGQFADVADLARDIRPEIDRITARMLDELALNPGNAPWVPAASTLSLVSPKAMRELKHTAVSR
ncbi:MAG: gamma subclass chorismate mutase AroQ, partial [Pseudomonadota bacterium]